MKFTTVTGKEDEIVFQNAAVGIPIMSTHGLTKEKKDLTYREHDGYITSHEDGATEPFITKDGVYFRQMLVPRAAVEKAKGHFHKGLQR